MNREEKDALKLIKKELFKEYSAYEYRKALQYCLKHRKEFKSNADVKFAVDNYLRENHDKNKCWKNKL